MNVCINHKCLNMIGLMCPKELMLTKTMVRLSTLFAITGTFFEKKNEDLIQKYVMIIMM